MIRSARGVLPVLAPGERVAVLGPSGVVDPARLASGLAYLRAKGHHAVPAGHLLARHGYLAGDDDARAADLNAFIAAREPRSALFARGGYGLTRILDRLDLAALRRRPRLLVGYSDVTALFMALQTRGPYPALYGPMVSELGDPAAFDEASFWSALYGLPASRELRFEPEDVVRQGKGAGVVIGGCLSVLVSLLGTRHDPDYRGSILFWEEIREEPYRIDRMLTQLYLSGILARASALVFGELPRCDEAGGSTTAREVVEELTSGFRGPILYGLPSGHTQGPTLTLPFGVRARVLTAPKPSLIIEEAAVTT